MLGVLLSSGSGPFMGYCLAGGVLHTCRAGGGNAASPETAENGALHTACEHLYK